MAATKSVGLDIGTTAVRAAQVDVHGGSRTGTVTLQKYHEVALPLGAVRDGEVADQSIVSHALTRLWSEGKFDTRDVVLGVGNQRVVVRELDIPSMPLAQIRTSLPFHVQDFLPVSTDEALLDFYPTGEADGEHGRVLQGMMVAAQRETVSANVLAAEGSGLRAMMVDLAAFGLMRSLLRGEIARRTIAIVAVGARLTTVVIACDGMPQMVRIIPAGGQQITEAVASSAGVVISDAERIKREIGVGFTAVPGRESLTEVVNSVAGNLVEAIRNTVSFYASGHGHPALEGLVLTGGGVQLPGLGQYIASSCRLPATLGNPLAGVQVARGLDVSRFAGQEASMSLAIGLAIGVEQ